MFLRGQQRRIGDPLARQRMPGSRPSPCLAHLDHSQHPQPQNLKWQDMTGLDLT